MYKKIIQMLIEARTHEDINKITAEIDRAFQHDKLTWKDNEQLYDLVAKIDGSFRSGVEHFGE